MTRAPLFRLLLSSPLLLLLAACGNGAPPTEAVRPAMVERPSAAGAAFEAFAGDVRARHETTLAFRVGGKSSRIVEARIASTPTTQCVFCARAVSRRSGSTWAFPSGNAPASP